MSTNRARISLLLTTFVFCGSGCAASANTQKNCPDCSDASISSAVRDKLFHEASLPSAYISVSTINGVVYLHGAVVTSVERDVAEQAARNVDGVVRVVDSIEIGGNE
jgi:osmotically-inducible protein OsmY